ncbi:hypothetical protein [Streptomyces resistomycificus]|uniref:hypothetical protein n=1 Tax=Streptomyces resistomycificus TaxID=67356 RepID=UPI001CECB760|nr:hypothetical protein [Streptomyces resistomycificus]
MRSAAAGGGREGRPRRLSLIHMYKRQSLASAAGRTAAVSRRSSTSTAAGVPGAAVTVRAMPSTPMPGPSDIPAVIRPVRWSLIVAVPPGGAGGSPGPKAASQPSGAVMVASTLHDCAAVGGRDRAAPGVTTTSNTGPSGVTPSTARPGAGPDGSVSTSATPRGAPGARRQPCSRSGAGESAARSPSISRTSSTRELPAGSRSCTASSRPASTVPAADGSSPSSGS